MQPITQFDFYTQDSANLIAESKISRQLCDAIIKGERSEFSLLLAMLSSDLIESTSKEKE